MAAMLRRISSPAFVGRASELAALGEVLDRARGGEGSAVLVEGEAGIGKSRLMSVFERRARALGAEVLVGECLQLAGGELAFAPIVSALRPVIEDAELLADLDPALRSAVGALWPAADLENREGTSREQLFEAVYRVLARLASRAPVLLIVEDVHWIDPSSRDLLAFLVHNARRDRLVVLATYRPDELRRGHPLRPFLAELERSGRAERFELTGLDRADVAEQTAAIIGRRPEPRIVDTIFGRSEGNPFYVEELLASADPAGGALPDSLREAFLLRVAQLSPSTRKMLSAAATIGRSVDHRLLAAVLDTSEHDLREATERHILVADGAGYRFRHALLREAIYEDTLPGERLRLHRAIAESMSERPELGGAAAELAHHWQAAGELPSALAASVLAAEEAARMNAHHEALGHLERALSLWDRVPDPPAIAGADRVELLVRASEMAENAGDAGLSIELAKTAASSVDENAQPDRAAAVQERLALAVWGAGRAPEALEHVARVIELVPAEPRTIERARALAGYGRMLMLTGAFFHARDCLDEAVEVADALKGRTVLASALNSLAIVYSQCGERRRAIEAGREGLRLSTELGDGPEITRAYINASQAIDDDGQLEEALALGLEGVEVAHRLALDRAAGDHLRMQAAWRLIRLGRFAQAERVISPAVENATLVFNVAASGNVAGYLAAVRGEFDQAHALLEDAWELMQGSGGFQLIGLGLAWRISLRLWRGQLAEAAALAREGLERAASAEGQLMYNAALTWLAARIDADLAERARALGRGADAHDAAAAADSACASLAAAIDSYPGAGAPPESLAFRALAGAEAARARGEHAADAWRSAAGRFGALGEAYHAAYAEMRIAEALALAGGPRRDVAEALRRAHAAALQLGAAPFRAEVEDLARRARVDLGLSERDAAGARPLADELGLSERELDVLALIAEGATNRQIGEALFITVKTASAHVSHILMKLGVSNRAQAAAVAHRVGLTRERA
jgi:ATP/maltotriose-dependent transcriptional regulator MalT